MAVRRGRSVAKSGGNRGLATARSQGAGAVTRIAAPTPWPRRRAIRASARRAARGPRPSIAAAKSLKPKSRPRSDGQRQIGHLRGRRDVGDVPADAEPEEQEAVAGTPVAQMSPSAEAPITSRPDDERAAMRPTRSISTPTTRTSAYMPSTCAPMIGKTSLLRVVMLLDDDVARQVHHRDHHAEARERSEHGRDHAGAAEDLARAARAAAAASDASAGAMSSAICFVSGRTSATIDAEPTLIAGRGEPRNGERVGLEVLAREERAEDGRAEDRAEHRAEEHVRDPARAALGRVHVAGGGTHEQRDRARRAGEDEPDDHGDRRRVVRSEGGERAADAADEKADDEHRPASEAVHRAAGDGAA